jgi:CheY-like chemotaxis protein
VKTIILVVDDEDPIRELVTRLLEDEGYRVVGARHGGHALELALAQPPALVLTDLMMPVMDGATLCRRLKDYPQTQSVSVVVMTASGRAAAEASGATAFIAKPLDLDALLELVARHAEPSANSDQ